ncbi:hypothetical protein [Silvibacterium acidisoli]|uniref:hypothetical protein n=1 Tax=Acidobacteriaceae bacterium ZG23-2 TaxID=2883246 RepID=UPI00406D359F
MVEDTSDKSCAKLTDANTWTTFPNDMAGVGTHTTLANFLAGNLDETAPEISSDQAPSVIGYGNGVTWASGDESTSAWSPQGMTELTVNSTNVHIVGWSYINANPPSGEPQEYPNGSRISIMNTQALSNAPYRDVILVVPTGSGTYKPAIQHAGGLAVFGHYLYTTNTSNGFHVFDLDNLIAVDGDSTLCKKSDGVTGIFGEVEGKWCADGYGYMLPEISEYQASDSCSTPVAYDWAAQDPRPSTPLLLSGEYCNLAGYGCGSTSSNNRALYTRLFQWKMDGNKLLTTNGIATPSEVFYVNQRNVQGAAPDQNSGYETNSYWLSSLRHDSSIIKVTPSDTAKYWSVDDGQAPWEPEGMFSTTAGHLWISTEGNDTSSGSLNTDPATGGRVLIYIDSTQIE